MTAMRIQKTLLCALLLTAVTFHVPAEETGVDKAAVAELGLNATNSAEATDSVGSGEIPPEERPEDDISTDSAAAPDGEAESGEQAGQSGQDGPQKNSGPEYRQIDLPGADRPETEKFRRQFLTKKWNKRLHDELEAALPYRLYVRKSIQEKNLPAVLEYLPVIESNYKTSAKSSSGALGMWQFMENSVRPFLTLNEFVDERLDPWKSTDAALKKLEDNYNYFGDWLIAIAAYNCGAGAMSRALKKSPQKDFWYLCENSLIPLQTAQYVPKLLAVADLALNSSYYGVEIPDHQEEFEKLYNETNGIFDYLTVTKAYSLNSLAQEMRMDPAVLRELNPSFVKGMTHPSRESKIRLPAGMKQTAVDALAAVSPIEFPFKYKVVAGDSLWAISRRFGVSVSSICDINGIEENAILRIGKILYIPSK